MKLLHTLSALCLTLSALACEGPKAVNYPVTLTLQPGQTQVESFDFTDCPYGIYNDQFFVSFPQQAKGFTVHLYDLTTGLEQGQVVSKGFVSFWMLNNGNSMAGHFLRMELSLDASAKKPIGVEIRQIPCWCGPP